MPSKNLPQEERHRSRFSIHSAAARIHARRDPRLVPFAIGLRLQCYRKANDPAGCRTSAEMWEKLNRPDAGSLYDAACYRAVTAAVQKQTPGADATRLAKEDADKAMAWLTKAVAAGYKDAAHMKKDSDLDSLREREDFKKLIAELEAKATKGPKELPPIEKGPRPREVK